MTHSLRCWLFIILISLSLLAAVTACSKKGDDPTPVVTPPAPTTGGITGTIDPAGSIRTVTATNAGGLTFPLGVSGSIFRFENLAAGVYTLSFTPAAGYNAPANRSLTVVAGTDAVAGTVSVSPQVSVLRGSVSWEIGATTFTAATLSGSLTAVIATAQTGAQADVLTLNLPGFNGVGTYRLENINQQNNAQYITSNGGVPTASYSTTVVGGLNGTVTVTSYDAATRTMSGTFGFVATNRVFTSATLTVSNGRFTLSY